jgi:hypothetical protein
LALLGGCANGDFGRLRPSLVHDDIHAWMGPATASAYGVPASPHALTDGERKLRDLAYPLIEPPYDRNKWYSVLGEYGFLRALPSSGWDFDRTTYGERLLSTPYRSATTRYAQLIEDIRNDVTRIGPFFATARRVLDLDRKREKSLAFVSALTESERANALSRVGENALIVDWVCRSLTQRAASYRFALERLVIATPSPMAVDAERALTLMQRRIAENRPASVSPFQ